MVAIVKGPHVAMNDRLPTLRRRLLAPRSVFEVGELIDSKGKATTEVYAARGGVIGEVPAVG